MKELELEMVRSVIIEGVTSFRYILLHLPTSRVSTCAMPKPLSAAVFYHSPRSHDITHAVLEPSNRTVLLTDMKFH
jgi:hypothetical protein